MLGKQQTAILMDIGGSGVRVSDYAGGKVGKSKEYTARSRAELIRIIRESAADKTVTGLAISIAGFVNPEEGRVVLSRNAKYLEGDLASVLEKEFPRAKAHIINDGEAHARALLRMGNTRFGAINLALGTSVAFGVINEKRQVVRASSGENWDIGDVILSTRATRKEVYWALGSEGLAELERGMPGEAYYQYGCRLGTFLNTLAVVFRPRTIGLSGGIILSHGEEILQGVTNEFHAPVASGGVDIVLQTERETVMSGLTTLL